MPKPLAEIDFEDTPTGSNASVEGVDGKAVRLTGDDAVDTSVGNFHRSQPFSVSLWIKTPDVKERAVDLPSIARVDRRGSRGYELLIEDGRLSWSLIHFWPGNAMRIRTLEPVPIDQWMHVVVTSDGSSRAGGLRIYVDGQRADAETVRDSLTKQYHRRRRGHDRDRRTFSRSTASRTVASIDFASSIAN